jgi:hypothetical protein
MQLSYQCPACGHANYSDELHPGSSLTCRSCAWSRHVSDTVEPAGGCARADLCSTHCLVCGNHDLWRQKDFPQGLGLALVALGAVLSSIAWYFHWPKTALGILMAFALADMVVFAVMPDVLVCYRCRARHHRARPPADHPGFNHELAERYRQEQLRLRDAARSGVA